MPQYVIIKNMNRLYKYVILLLFIFIFQNASNAIQYANIEYTIPIDYSKIDKNALANQANLFFNYFEQITDLEYRKKYIQPLLNRYSVLSLMEPDNPLNYTRMAILYDEMKTDKLAKSNFYRAINITPNYYYAHYSFGNYYYKRGYYRLALKQYLEAKNIQAPYNYDCKIKLGAIYEKFGNYKDAITMYRDAYNEKNSRELYDKILLLEDLNTKNMLYH